MMNERSSLRTTANVALRYTASSEEDENVVYSIAPNGNDVNSSVNATPSDHEVTSKGPDKNGTTSGGEWTAEEELMAKRNVEHPTSNLDVMMHIIKCNVGTGILAIPDALKNAGLTVGTIGLAIVSIICVHCMHVALKCSRHLCLRTRTASLDFSSTAQYSFATGPSSLRRFSQTVRFLTNFFLCVTQLGFCCVYLVFVSNNIKDIVDRNSPSGPDLDYRVYMAIVLVPIILTNLLRNLKFLAPASTVANILQVVSLGLIFYFIWQDIPPVSSRPQFVSFKTLPLWFGTIIFSFEGIGLVLPLENCMKRPQDFGGLTGVLNTSMVIVSCTYIAVGFYGYLKYGDSVLGSITLNLPNDILADVVRGAYSVAIFLTYAVQFFVPVQVMWPTVQKRLPNKFHYVGEVAFRIFIILITFALASLIPQLSLFISLVGAFSASCISVILPPVLEMVTFWNDGLTRMTFAKDVVILIIGILGCITGTYVSIEQIVTTFGKYS